MPEPAPEAAPAVPMAKLGNGRARQRRAREIPFRDIGRSMTLFAAADAAISLLLPWMKTPAASVTALGPGALPWGAMGLPGAAWVGTAVWFVLGAAVAAAAAALVDRARDTGAVAPYVSFADP